MRTNVSGCAYRLMWVWLLWWKFKMDRRNGSCKMWGASVTDRDCTCSPKGAHNLCACVCVSVCYFLFDLLVHSHLTRLMQTTPPPHFSPIFSQSGWLNIWTAQMRALPWWRLMFAKYLPSFGPKATVIWEEPKTSTGASAGLNRITNYTLEPWNVTWDLNLTVTPTHLFSSSATIDFLICY